MLIFRAVPVKPWALCFWTTPFFLRVSCTYKLDSFVNNAQHHETCALKARLQQRCWPILSSDHCILIICAEWGLWVWLPDTSLPPSQQAMVLVLGVPLGKACQVPFGDWLLRKQWLLWSVLCEHMAQVLGFSMAWTFSFDAVPISRTKSSLSCCLGKLRQVPALRSGCSVGTRDANKGYVSLHLSFRVWEVTFPFIVSQSSPKSRSLNHREN